MAQSAYQAGGGDAQLRKFQKLDQYRNFSSAQLRKLVEQKGQRALASERSSKAASINNNTAFIAGGGNAAVNALRINSGNRNMSTDQLRALVAQRGRKAVSGGPAPSSNKPGTSGKPKIDYSKYDVDSEAPKGPNLIKPAEKQPTTPPISASEQKTTTTRPPAAKSESKTESKPAAKASETYREGGKGLYQGTQEYRDKVGGSGNPLLNRFRRDMGRDAKTGERQYSTPEDKSKYVDKNGQLKIKDKPTAAATSNSNTNTSTRRGGGDNAGTYEKTKQSVENETKAAPFAMRNRFETPEQRRRRLALEGRASK